MIKKWSNKNGGHIGNKYKNGKCKFSIMIIYIKYKWIEYSERHIYCQSKLFSKILFSCMDGLQYNWNKWILRKNYY
jgi:hypothetical protein